MGTDPSFLATDQSLALQKSAQIKSYDHHTSVIHTQNNSDLQNELTENNRSLKIKDPLSQIPTY